MFKDDIKRIIIIFLDMKTTFYSEKQFQFELAWFIKEHIPDIDIEFETKVEIDGKTAYIDLVVGKDNIAVPIELKRKTRKQGAADEGCYDFFLDIHRLERIQGTKCYVDNKIMQLGKGLAIMITDFGSYYNGPRNNECYWMPFSLRNERTILPGIYKWNISGNKGLTLAQKRGSSISIVNEYLLEWKFVDDHNAYLIVEV